MSSPDVSVRPAVPEDAAHLADIHARTLRASLQAGTGTELGADVAARLSPEQLQGSWAAAIAERPTPLHLVLTAVAGAQIVGFAAMAPAEAPVAVAATEAPANDGAAPAGPADPGTPGAQAPQSVVEILALEVPAAHGRAGHGSRLLAACADLARERGVTRLQTWAVQGDEARARFLAGAGFAPLGVRRVLDLGERSVVEICWHAALGPTP